jgi:hypothetical protein
VRRYVAHLFDRNRQRRDLSTATVHKHLSILKLLFTRAVEDGLLRYSPAAHTRISRPALTGASSSPSWPTACRRSV